MQGERFKEDIKKAISNNSFFNEKLMPYSKTQEGVATYGDLYGAVKKALPQYLEEVEGMAEGAGMEFSMVSEGDKRRLSSIYRKYSPHPPVIMGI